MLVSGAGGYGVFTAFVTVGVVVAFVALAVCEFTHFGAACRALRVTVIAVSATVSGGVGDLILVASVAVDGCCTVVAVVFYRTARVFSTYRACLETVIAVAVVFTGMCDGVYMAHTAESLIATVVAIAVIIYVTLLSAVRTWSVAVIAVAAV